MSVRPGENGAQTVKSPFVEYLEGLKRGNRWTPIRAALRRSLAFEPGLYPPAYPYVEPFLPQEAGGWKRAAYYLVAGLYALKDGDHQPRRSLAQALAEERRRRDSKSLELRFLALLDADEDQVAHRLRQAVGLVQGGLDFAELLQDLINWKHPKRQVQARWASEFYRDLSSSGESKAGERGGDEE
ncbi:MAG: type I-E CRISPR-associated protein Cse2/CasB [Thermaceae bacterium]